MDSYSQGKSEKEDVYNLVGNVSEWTASLFQGSYENYNLEKVWKSSQDPILSDLTIRGKSYQAAIKRVTERLPAHASHHGEDTGIRCAK